MITEKKKRKKRTSSKQWFIIYEITNIETNEKYVGITGIRNGKAKSALQKRFDFHIKRSKDHDDTLICQSIRKYGEDKFEIKCLEKIQGRPSALKREKELIQENCCSLNMIHRTKRNTTYRSILKRMKLPTHRLPTHPGDLFREEFLPYIQLSVNELAKTLTFDEALFANFLEGWSGALPNPSQCIFLSKITGMSLKFWLNMTNDYLTSSFVHSIDMEKFKALSNLLNTNV